jgi:hypothetical protein
LLSAKENTFFIAGCPTMNSLLLALVILSIGIVDISTCAQITKNQGDQVNLFYNQIGETAANFFSASLFKHLGFVAQDVAHVPR